MAYEHYIIDSFASELGMGNPAAVLLDARGLTDDQMQQIAADFNLSETTFILHAEVDDPVCVADLSVRFRWFTPMSEVDLCGHASVAGLRAMYDSGRLDRWRNDPSIHVRIETRSGDLDGFIEKVPGEIDEPMIWLTLPSSVISPVELALSTLARVLGTDAGAFDCGIRSVRTGDGDVIVFVRDVATLNGIAPDFDELGVFLTDTDSRGLLVATTSTLTPSITVQSRFFAPTLGVNEDPVTGSVTGPLAIHLVEEGIVEVSEGTAGLACVQGIPGGRTGLIYALVQRDDSGAHAVRIGGRAIVSSKGVYSEA